MNSTVTNFRSIPEHDRIVRVRGSVIDHSYAGGIPAVLIIMDKLNRDLYCAIKMGLPWLTRLQVICSQNVNNLVKICTNSNSLFN